MIPFSLSATITKESPKCTSHNAYFACIFKQPKQTLHTQEVMWVARAELVMPCPARTSNLDIKWSITTTFLSAALTTIENGTCQSIPPDRCSSPHIVARPRALGSYWQMLLDWQSPWSRVQLAASKQREVHSLSSSVHHAVGGTYVCLWPHHQTPVPCSTQDRGGSPLVQRQYRNVFPLRQRSDEYPCNILEEIVLTIPS